VFQEEPTEKEVQSLLKSYERLCNIFPFLGELEIHTREDWEASQEAQRRFFPVADLIRQLRKWKAQLTAVQEAPTNYHAFKAQDAIARIRTNLGLPATPPQDEDLKITLRDIIETRMSGLVSKELLIQNRRKEPLNGYSGFLGWDLPQMNLCFVASLPDADWKFTSHAGEIQTLRKNPEIQALLRALCTIEWVTLKHHKRVGEIEIVEDWFQLMWELSGLKASSGSSAQVIWFTGLPCSGKTTLALALAERLKSKGLRIEHLDGDLIRKNQPDLGFSQKDRNEHIKRVAKTAKELESKGVFVVASFVSPYRETRKFARELCSNFVEVHVSTPLSECERRDTKGLYARARKGEIPNFTGIGQIYEEPSRAEITLDTTSLSIDESVNRILTFLKMSY
jgi:adenylyl-sulfate kinase